MADKLVKTFANGIRNKPVSADPVNPQEGQQQMSDGTHRTQGTWEYSGGQWLYLARAGAKQVRTETANYTAVLTDDVILGNPTAATDITITLPTAVGNDGKEFVIKKINSSIDDTVTIDADGTETIDGALTLTLDLQYHSVTLVSDGANWIKTSEEEPVVALRATLSADEVGVTDKTIAFDGSDFDTQNILNTSTGIVTSPTTGKYQVNAFARIQNLDNAASYQIQIRKNGAFLATFGLIPFINSADIKTVAGSDMIELAKGDTLEVFVDGDASFDIDTLSYLTVHKIKNF